jgi:hypothetical protein
MRRQTIVSSGSELVSRLVGGALSLAHGVRRGAIRITAIVAMLVIYVTTSIGSIGTTALGAIGVSTVALVGSTAPAQARRRWRRSYRRRWHRGYYRGPWRRRGRWRGPAIYFRL